MLEVRDISKSFSDKPIVSDLSFSVNDSECLAIVGPSGSGKTTILKLINRLLAYDSGSILFLDKSVTDWDLKDLRKQISYIFQKGILFPHLTVFDNLALCKQNEMKNTEMIFGFQAKKDIFLEEIAELLDFVEIDFREYAGRYPAELSGGQAQRVALALALMNKPKLLLLDEPFNGIDKSTKTILINKFKELKKRGTSMVLVSHNQEEIEGLSDRSLELKSLVLSQ